MGISYAGPYADDVNHDAYHEGFAGRLWPDGTLTGSWGGDVGWTGHIGLVGTCDCGWRPGAIHPAGECDGQEYQTAEHDFETQHLDPMIEEAKQRSWPHWVARVSARATEIANLVHNGRWGDATDILDGLREDVAHRAVTLAELHAEREYAAHRAAAEPAHPRPFIALDNDHPAPPPTVGAGNPPVPEPAPHHGNSR
jgi:hypothetical protein